MSALEPPARRGRKHSRCSRRQDRPPQAASRTSAPSFRSGDRASRSALASGCPRLRRSAPLREASGAEPSRLRSPGPTEIGRLASITRNGQSVDSCYDHFGRLVQDGELGYAYDANGNRTEIVYPGGVTASYSFDFADRETGLEVTTPAGGTTPHAVASGATYLPSGPLAGLTLGNGASEIRGFDGKNAPTGIALSGLTGSLPGRSWAYATDPVGNVTEIVETAECAGGGSAVVVDPQTVTTTETFRSCGDLQAGGGFSVESPGVVRFEAEGTIALADGFSVGTGARFVAGGLSDLTHRTFGYQPPQDFLTSADGPWGTLDWTYDKIGNRLSESRDDGTSVDGYVYKANGAGSDTPILDLVNLAVVGTRGYTWDDAGNLNQVAAGANVIDFQLDQASRLAAADRTGSGGGAAAFLYDGRGFLRSAAETSGGTSSVAPLYDSAGLLRALRRQPMAQAARVRKPRSSRMQHDSFLFDPAPEHRWTLGEELEVYRDRDFAGELRVRAEEPFRRKTFDGEVDVGGGIWLTPGEGSEEHDLPDAVAVDQDVGRALGRLERTGAVLLSGRPLFGETAPPGLGVRRVAAGPVLAVGTRGSHRILPEKRSRVAHSPGSRG